jgi:hypothetical protein
MLVLATAAPSRRRSTSRPTESDRWGSRFLSPSFPLSLSPLPSTCTRALPFYPSSVLPRALSPRRYRRPRRSTRESTFSLLPRFGISPSHTAPFPPRDSLPSLTLRLPLSIGLALSPRSSAKTSIRAIPSSSPVHRSDQSVTSGAPRAYE